MTNELDNHVVISLYEGDSRRAWIGYAAIAALEMAGYSYPELETRLNSQQSTVTDFMLLLWASTRTFDKSLSFDDFVALLDARRVPFTKVRDCVLKVVETMGAGLYSVAADAEKLKEHDPEGEGDEKGERVEATSVASAEVAGV